MTITEPRTWTLSCKDHGPDAVNRYRNFGSAETRYRYGRATPDAVVRLTEDVDGDLMGWVPAGAEDLDKVEVARFFNMWFYEGYEAAESRGEGRAVRLRLEVLAAVGPGVGAAHE